MAENVTVDVVDAQGKKAGTAELPGELFDVQTNVPLIHQVVVHGPVPRDYSQRTPKKMKAAALRGALSDRARAGRVHVVEGFGLGEAPSTKAALAALAGLTQGRSALV